MAPTSVNPKPLAAAVVILLLLTVMPARWTGFLGQCSTIADLLVGPVSGPVSALAKWVLPTSQGRVDDAALAHAEQEAKRFEMLYLQERAKNEDLRQRNAELANMRMLPEEAPVRLVPARVIGASPDPGTGLIQVRAGRNQDVEINTVAVVGTQLVGRVVDVDDRTAWVRVITAPLRDRPIRGRICVGDDPDLWLECNLYAQPGGTLKGVFEYKAGMPERVAPGMEVRLTDDGGDWPASARMLIIGEITQIDPTTNQVGRYATVKPTIDRLELLSEVTLRVPAPEAIAPNGPSMEAPR